MIGRIAGRLLPTAKRLLYGGIAAVALACPGDAVTLSPHAPAGPPPRKDIPVHLISPPPMPCKKWTVMMYGGNDNSLYDCVLGNIKELETVGSGPQTNLVVQVVAGPQNVLHRVYVNPQDTGTLALKPSANTADPQQLAEFGTWGVKTFPAEHYLLIVNSHGGGWNGAIEDATHKGWMDLPGIQKALETIHKATGRKIDVLGFDACNMSTIEVAHQLQCEVDYLIASQQAVGGNGWPYPKLVQSGVLQHDTPRQLSRDVVRLSEDRPDIETFAAIDMKEVPALAKAVDEFAKAIKASPLDDATLRQAAADSQKFNRFHDVYDFAQKTLALPDRELRTKALGVMQAIERTVFAERHNASFPNAHGLSMQLFKTEGYNTVSLGAQTTWSDAQARLGDEPVPPKPDHKGDALAIALGVLLAAHVGMALRHRHKVRAGPSPEPAGSGLPVPERST